MKKSFGKLSKNLDEDCICCFKKASYWFELISLFERQYGTYCSECLDMRLTKVGFRR